MNQTHDHQTPGKRQECIHKAEKNLEKAEAREIPGPFSAFMPNESREQEERNQDFRPVMANVFAEDMKGLAHRRLGSRIGSCFGHGKEDGA